MDNYIDFYYDENDNFIADIFSNGKLKRVRNPKNIDKLISIAEKYNYVIEDEGRITKRVTPIINEFGKYMLEKKRKRDRKINIYNTITSSMKLSRKDPTLGKKIGTGLLAFTILATGIGAYKHHSEKRSKEPVETSDQLMEDNSSPFNDSFEIIEDHRDMDTMFQDNSFHFSYEERTKTNNIERAKEYIDLFEKYGNMYGVDPHILLAIAAQESGGNHYDNLKDELPASGIMQIEKSVHTGESISAYNFETNKIDNLLITEENLKDLETNIQIATILFKNCLKENNYNIPLAIQAYNYGYGNIYYLLASCSKSENITIDEIKNNPTINCWLNYRKNISVGDPEYVEHVLSYLDTGSLTVRTSTGDIVTVNLKNDYQKSVQYN
ncbi:MAG: transglycosylase SLT domain-containing protein [Bacilli bacterium]|nr:transglycosylase SLT domain-containing protein [Bacilli bacterium]